MTSATMAHGGSPQGRTSEGLTFSDVDSSGNENFFVDYLDAVRSFRAMGPIDGEIAALVTARAPRVILEIGCGTGDLLASLTASANPPIRGIGVEKSAALAEEARRRHQPRGHLDFVVHDFVEGTESGELSGRGLGLGGADAILLNRVVQHVAQPLELLRHARPWLRSGGVIVISDVDWTSLAITHEDPDTTRLILAELVAHFAFPKAGSVLTALLAEAGYATPRQSLGLTHEVQDFALAAKLLPFEPAIERLAAKGILDREAGAAWLASGAKAEAEGRFSASLFQSVVWAEVI